MKSILLNLSQIKAEKTEKNSKGDTIVRLTLAKLKYPKQGGVTDILYHKPTKEERSSSRRPKPHVVGCGIEKADIIKSTSDSFFMVFVEGGNAPAVSYPTHDEALAQAVHLSERLGLKAWVLESISAVSKAEPQELTEEELKGDLSVEVPVKKKRERKPLQPQKVTYRNK